ncbi:DsbA family protein [Arcicella aquatica]|uniref:DsbA family protein n=1 Tax=Arcicella aquatica TaxID=217141 RepID=A0ABU5QTQ2_9BACT|nr:DsbA family protein [Arcicella aquatica]MEA5260491.1 DsbA family protein [Arcicella aquatica]
MIENSNPLLCDIEKGICEMPHTYNTDEHQDITSKPKKTVKIIYFTDPICSSCWGIEPQLRKLKLEYGTDIEIEYRMGGLLPNWNYFNSGGIAKPSDVAHHWDEVSEYYDMPIDGDVWLEDPLHSSFPPSVAFKAAQLQDEAKAVLFMRRIREMVFLEKKNITNWAHLSLAANEVGLDSQLLKHDYETQAKELFQEDLALAQKLGVRGFPTLFFSDGSHQKTQTVYGFRPYQAFENAILNTFPKATQYQYDASWIYLFNKYPRLTTREFAELSGNTKSDSEKLLQQLTRQGKLSRTDIKNGTIWTINKDQTPTT